MKSIYFFVIVLLLVSCKQDVTNNAQTVVLKVNLSPTDISIYDLFDSIQVIPLETRDSCLLMCPVKVLTTSLANYILDWRNFQIFVFDNMGHFSHVIGKKGQGPGEYSQIYDVIVDEERNLVRMISPFGSIYNYNLQGQFINETRLPAKSNYQKIEELDSCTIITWSMPTSSEDSCMTIVDANTGVEKTSLWKGPRILNASIGTVFYTYNSRLYFTPTFDNNKVYEITGDSLKLAFQWDFGKDNIDISKYDFTFTDEKIGEENPILDQYLKDGVIPYRLSQQYENDAYHFISFDYNFFENKKLCFYRKKDAKSFMFDRTKEGIKIKFPMDFTDEYVAFITPGEELASYKSVLSPVEYEKLMSRTEDDNPCLVKLYLSPL